MEHRGMDASEPASVSTNTAARPVAASDTRRLGRDRAFEPARIAIDGALLDCALLERSRNGARVCLYTPVAVPAIATLILLSGEAWTVRRQWQQGAQVGFMVLETAPPAPATG